MIARKKRQEIYFFKKVVKIPIYGGNFIIIFSNNPGRVAKLVNVDENEIDPLYAHTFWNFLYRKYESFCVCFNFWSSDAVTTGTLVHEISHVGNRLLLSRDFDAGFINDEAESYLKGWMGDQIESFMKKCNIV